jgi:hypothetical protein
MLVLYPPVRPVTHAVTLSGGSQFDAPRGDKAAWVAGAESLRMATQARRMALENGAFWQALLHPELNLDTYGNLLLQLSCVWTPISRSLRERAAALHRNEWLPVSRTARLQADLACLRRMGVVQPAWSPRRIDLPRGDTSHLLGMVTMVRQLQLHAAKMGPRLDDRLGLTGEGRQYFLDVDGCVEAVRQDWVTWCALLDRELRTLDACDSAIRGACALVDTLHHSLSDPVLMD